MKYIYYLSLGANLGDKLTSLSRAIEALGSIGDVARVSQMYETPPWGKLDQPAFVNCAAIVVSELPPLAFLHHCQRIEKALGRVRHEHWGARTIDVDMLLVQATGDLPSGQRCYAEIRQNYMAVEFFSVDMQELQLPHPYMLERAFVMVPLAEIAPELVLDGGRTAQEICDSLPDKSSIVRLDRSSNADEGAVLQERGACKE